MFNSQHYSYRKRDRLIFQVIDVVETWLNRSILQCNANDTTPAPPLSFVPVFVTKWIDYSNKYGFGYQVFFFSWRNLFYPQDLKSNWSNVQF